MNEQFHSLRMVRLALGVVVTLIAGLASSSRSDADELRRRANIVADAALTELATELARGFARSDGNLSPGVETASAAQAIDLLVARRGDVVLRSGEWSGVELRKLRYHFPNHDWKRPERLATAVVSVVVHRQNSLDSVGRQRLQDIYRDEVTDWKDVEAKQPTGRIEIFSPALASFDAAIFNDRVMRGWKFSGRLTDYTRLPLRQKINSVDLISAVANNPQAIGFFMMESGHAASDGVKLLKVADRAQADAVSPDATNIWQGKYPLTADINLYLHPHASIEAHDFCDFVISAEAASIIKKHRLWPEYERQGYFANQRLIAARKGEGPKLTMAGPRAGINVMRELAAEYVKAEEVVQLGYAARTQMLAVRDFTTRAADWKEGEKYRRGADIILLDDKVQHDTYVAHGPSWLRSISPEEKWELGRIGVAVVAHKSNPVDWLSMDELRDIYTNRLREWERLERGNNPAAAPLGAMKRYGLKSGQPVFLVFADKTLEGRPITQYAQRETTEEVIASVALDLAAIGFVSLTDLKPEENRVKILGITPKDGLFPETIGPEGPTEKYPLQQRWTLYLGPYAGPEAKRFAKFLISNETAAAEVM